MLKFKKHKRNISVAIAYTKKIAFEILILFNIKFSFLKRLSLEVASCLRMFWVKMFFFYKLRWPLKVLSNKH